MGQFAQQNSAASEEMAATTEEVNGMAQNLHRLVDSFKYSR